MGKGKKYDDKFRANAVVLLEAAGYPERRGALDEVSKHLSVHYSTLHGWFNQKHNPAPADLVAEARIELTDAISNELDSIFEAMKTVRQDASYRDLAVAAGIFIDKKQLLSGQPTGNIKQAITFERTGISTLPEHLAPGTVEGIEREETL